MIKSRTLHSALPAALLLLVALPAAQAAEPDTGVAPPGRPPQTGPARPPALQGQPPQSKPNPPTLPYAPFVPNTKGPETRSPDAKAPPSKPAAPGHTGVAGQPLPDTPAERAKLLSNLYAYLATAEDWKQAEPVAQAIERLWLYNPSDTIAVLMDRSVVAINQRNFDLAVRFLDAVVDLAPDYAEGWHRRAFVHHLRNDTERMLGDVRRCLALEPNHFRAMELLGIAMRDSGQKKAALKAFERLLEINPNAPGLADAVKELTKAVEGERI